MNKKKYSRIFKHSIMYGIFSFTFLFYGCSTNKLLPKIMPVQTARITQIDFFTQVYVFETALEAQNGLIMLIGHDNWNVLEELAYDTFTQALFNKKISIKGGLTTTLYLIPTARDSFFIEGTGQYNVIDDSSKVIIYSASFYIKGQRNRFSITDLDRAKLPIKVNQVLIKHFEPKELNYFHDALIYFYVHINTKLAHKSIYAIDYNAKHEVYIENTLVGYLQFDKPVSPWDKLIDMRGIDLIRNDYSKMIEELN